MCAGIAPADCKTSGLIAPSGGARRTKHETAKVKTRTLISRGRVSLTRVRRVQKDPPYGCRIVSRDGHAAVRPDPRAAGPKGPALRLPDRIARRACGGPTGPADVRRIVSRGRACGGTRPTPFDR